MPVSASRRSACYMTFAHTNALNSPHDGSFSSSPSSSASSLQILILSFRFLAVFRYLHSLSSKVHHLLHRSVHSFILLFACLIATMKPALTAGLVASALVLQQAAASSWGDAPSFSNPQNTNNNCSADQDGGFNWSGLPTGGFDSFGGFGFSGFSCEDSFQPNQKRSLRTRSDFQVSISIFRCIRY